MKLLHGCPEMEWMPSRHHFALFRLISWLRLSQSDIPTERDCILSIHQDQSGPELMCVGFWTLGTTTCFVAALLPGLALPAALAVALPAAWIALQLALFVTGLVIAPMARAIARRPGNNNLGINSFSMMSMLVAASLWFSMHRTWVRFIAWQFLLAVALNALAAAVLFLFRERVARLEGSFGGETSALSSLRSR